MTLMGLKWLTIREWHEQHSQFLQWSLICSDTRRFLSGLLSEILIKSLSLIGNIDKSFVDIYFLKLGLFSMKTEQNNNCFTILGCIQMGPFVPGLQWAGFIWHIALLHFSAKGLIQSIWYVQRAKRILIKNIS